VPHRPPLTHHIFGAHLRRRRRKPGVVAPQVPGRNKTISLGTRCTVAACAATQQHRTSEARRSACAALQTRAWCTTGAATTACARRGSRRAHRGSQHSELQQRPSGKQCMPGKTVSDAATTTRERPHLSDAWTRISQQRTQVRSNVLPCVRRSQVEARCRDHQNVGSLRSKLRITASKQTVRIYENIRTRTSKLRRDGANPAQAHYKAPIIIRFPERIETGDNRVGNLQDSSAAHRMMHRREASHRR
jgi:hypothetical protein